MSPTEAMNAAAVCRLTPGTVISRRISGEPSASTASAASSAPDLGVEEVDLAQTSVEGQPLVDRQL
jgi:hypothetical protein